MEIRRNLFQVPLLLPGLKMASDYMNLNLELLDWLSKKERIKEIWNKLLERSGASYFLSWGWIENWMNTLPKSIPIQLVVVSENDRPIMAFFLGKASHRRKKIIRSRGIFLNETGLPGYDDLCIEYNSFVYDDSIQHSLKFILDHLPIDWEEFCMSGLDVNCFPGKCLQKSLRPYNVCVQKEASSPFVDLAELRKNEKDYLSLLSSNTRYQIRRSYRDYESYAPVTLEIANNLDHAIDIFDEMVGLHTKTWRSRGHPGSFASNFFYQFHKNLISNRFDTGEIQLLRIKYGSKCIGCLYNFVFNLKVYFYQSGFNYEKLKTKKPGLVSHFEAIKYNASIGNRYYDFLGEDSRYKSSLSTHKNKLVWAKIQKPKAKFLLETKLKKIRDHFTGVNFITKYFVDGKN